MKVQVQVAAPEAGWSNRFINFCLITFILGCLAMMIVIVA